MKWFRPAIISLGFGAILVGFFMKLVPSDVFVPFVTGLVVWWFRSRDVSKEQSK